MEVFGATVEPIVALFLLGEIAVLLSLVAAYFLGRLHKGTLHHYVMLVAFLVDLLVFKPLMYLRATDVWGAFPWEGTRIAPHLLLSVAAGAIGAASVVLGFKFRVKKGPRMFMPPKGKMHKTLGLLFLVVWSVAFVIGLLVFVETYLP